MSRQATPEYLVPRMGTAPISSSRHYRTATITGLLAGQQETRPIVAPMSVPEPGQVAQGQPALGVLLTHEQQWIIAGTALGPLVHSVCLAPGEVTQIAVRNQTRRVLQNSVDRGMASDVVASATDGTTEVEEAEKTGVRQTESGSTITSAGSNTTQLSSPAIGNLVGINAAGSTTLAGANQAAVNNGVRSVADQANQSVHQSARDQAASARSRTSAAVREVSESDSVEISTRVIANYNHMHALTMEYFEVEQVYQLRTRVTDAERLIFVPMKLIDFSDPDQATAAVSRFRNELISVARELGLDQVAARLVYDRAGVQVAQPSGLTAWVTGESAGDQLEQQLAALSTALTAATGATVAARTASDKAVDDVAKARDELRAARDGTLLARTQAQRTLQRAMAAAEQAEQALAGAQAVERSARGRFRSAGLESAQRRLATTLTDEALRDALDAQRLAVNQGIWMRLDPSVAAGFLQRRVVAGEALGDLVDPTPVAVSGDMLGFRWRFGDLQEEAAFVAEHRAAAGDLEQTVAVPTGGLFGEAVLGTSNGAERIDLTRFWNWKDSLPPIRPAQIAPLTVGSREPLKTAAAAAAPAAQLDLGPVSFPATTSPLPGVAALLADPNLFRDLSGSATTVALAQSAMELSASGATEAAKLANANFQRFLSFQRAVADSVVQATKKGPVDATMSGGALNAATEAKAAEPQPQPQPEDAKDKGESTGEPGTEKSGTEKSGTEKSGGTLEVEFDAEEKP